MAVTLHGDKVVVLVLVICDSGFGQSMGVAAAQGQRTPSRTARCWRTRLSSAGSALEWNRALRSDQSRLLS